MKVDLDLDVVCDLDLDAVCVWGAAAAAAEEDCSFASLFKHLNLNDKTDPRGSIRPVRNWTTPTRVWVNLLVYGIIEVVGAARRAPIGPIVPRVTVQGLAILLYP